MDSVIRCFSNERGAVGLTSAIVMVLLFIVTAFAIDLSYGWMAKNQLQKVADGAALAGARELGLIYEGLDLEEQQQFVLTPAYRTQILDAMDVVANNNMVAGVSMMIDANDIAIGQWQDASNALIPAAARPNAVSVLTRRDRTANGSIGTFFARAMGINSLEVSSRATAALLPLTVVPEGVLSLPVGISKAWFEGGGSCPNTIKFHPTGTLDGCAGWHSFQETPANAARLTTMLDGLTNGTYTSPEVVAGSTNLQFIGGAVASAFPSMKALYEANRDPLTGDWVTTIVVYDRADCSNPSGPIKVVGIVTAVVTAVHEAPDKEIIARVECDAIDKGRNDRSSGGGSSDYGTIGSYPSLVS